MRENKVMGIIFSDMHDNALGKLTERRTTGSVPFGGRYRLIDFTLSSMVNAGIHDIGIITKSNYQSLMDHVGAGRPWDLARKRGGLVIIPPFATQGNGIYRGRLEALYSGLSFINHNDAEYVLISDCDTIASVDYRAMIQHHIKSGAQITLLCHKEQVVPDMARDMVTLSYDEQTNNVTDILVRPDSKGEQNVYMNTLIVERVLLERLVSEGKAHDQYSLVRHMLQQSMGRVIMKVYLSDAFMKKIAGMSSYFEANMDLLSLDVRNELFTKERPVFTKVRDQVPTKYGLSSKVENSLIADGCVINGEVYDSVIFRGVKIGKGAVIRNSIIMQDSYIGENAHLDYVVADKDVLIKDARTLSGYATYPLYVTKGSMI